MREFKDYPMDTDGIWDIYGEDPNPEMFGPHVEPFLGRVEGSYADAVAYAKTLKDFVAWGSGGKIRKYIPLEIKDIRGYAINGVAEEMKALEEKEAELLAKIEAVQAEKKQKGKYLEANRGKAPKKG